MFGRTWKNVEDSVAEKIKFYLLEHGGEEQEIRNANEKWRIRFLDSTFTYYKNGTLYSTPSRSNDAAVLGAWIHIDSLVVPYLPTEKEFLIGLDETGKGEVIGHLVLAGVVFPKSLYEKVNLIVGAADTKKRHDFSYWDKIFRALDTLRKEGFNFIVEKIPPWQIDKFNINKIMDVTYQRILNIFFRKVKIGECRIVLDDYNVGLTLSRFLKFLTKRGAEVVVTTRADEEYLEAKTASLVSKRFRESVIKAINESPEFEVNGVSVGSGNAGDPQTLEWLRKWYESGREWPWFVKKSFSVVRKLEGKEEFKKLIPPINESLLSNEFLAEFNSGHLSIQSLSLVCPWCGEILKSATFATFKEGKRLVSELKCPNCNRFIRDSGFTLRYYCGYVIPDSSAIQRNLISNDLAASRFFEDFTIILTPVVRKECDKTPRGRKEFKELHRYNSMGRIRLESPGSVSELPTDLPSTARDEEIIKACLEYNAILLTADMSMCAFAGGKNVFTIFI